MNKADTIDPTQAREKVHQGEALLVCAYEDPQRCRDLLLHGAISLDELESIELSKDREIIFYCNCPNEETSRRRAEEYRRQGFVNSRVLLGGVRGWKYAGYPLAAETSPANPPMF